MEQSLVTKFWIIWRPTFYREVLGPRTFIAQPWQTCVNKTITHAPTFSCLFLFFHARKVSRVMRVTSGPRAARCEGGDADIKMTRAETTSRANISHGRLESISTRTRAEVPDFSQDKWAHSWWSSFDFSDVIYLAFLTNHLSFPVWFRLAFYGFYWAILGYVHKHNF